MKRNLPAFSLFAVLVAVPFKSPADTNIPPTLSNWMFTTPAYNKEALRLVIQEANRAAEELKLPGELPITETNILQCFITPYAMSRHTYGSIGNVTTSMYTYYVSIDGKFSYLERSHQDAEHLK